MWTKLRAFLNVGILKYPLNCLMQFLILIN